MKVNELVQCGLKRGTPINQRPQPPMATQADKDYAAAIKAAIQKEQSPASGE